MTKNATLTIVLSADDLDHLTCTKCGNFVHEQVGRFEGVGLQDMKAALSEKFKNGTMTYRDARKTPPFRAGI